MEEVNFFERNLKGTVKKNGNLHKVWIGDPRPTTMAFNLCPGDRTLPTQQNLQTPAGTTYYSTWISKLQSEMNLFFCGLSLLDMKNTENPLGNELC